MLLSKSRAILSYFSLPSREAFVVLSKRCYLETVEAASSKLKVSIYFYATTPFCVAIFHNFYQHEFQFAQLANSLFTTQTSLVGTPRLF